MSKIAQFVIQRFMERKENVEEAAFYTILAQGGKIDVRDGGSMFEFCDGSRIYTSSDVVGLCYDAPCDLPKPIKWTSSLDAFDWSTEYKRHTNR